MTLETLKDIDAFTDEQALWGLDYVGRIIAAHHQKPPSLLAREVRSLNGFDASLVPQIEGGSVVGGPEATKRAGRIARYALKAGLEDVREEVRQAVAMVVAEAREPESVKSLTAVLLIGGMVLLGLAVLSKLEVTPDGKIILHPGLPDIDKAGEAIGKLIHAALGGGSGDK
jgi:hypothetical protein